MKFYIAFIVLTHLLYSFSCSASQPFDQKFQPNIFLKQVFNKNPELLDQKGYISDLSLIVIVDPSYILLDEILKIKELFDQEGNISNSSFSIPKDLACYFRPRKPKWQ